MPNRLLRNAVCWLALSQGRSPYRWDFRAAINQRTAPENQSADAVWLTKTDIVLSEGTPQPIPFETGEVTIGEPLPVADYCAHRRGRVAHCTNCYAPMEGRLDHVAVKLGDHVEAGAKLALIRSGYGDAPA